MNSCYSFKICCFFSTRIFNWKYRKVEVFNVSNHQAMQTCKQIRRRWKTPSNHDSFFVFNKHDLKILVALCPSRPTVRPVRPVRSSHRVLNICKSVVSAFVLLPPSLTPCLHPSIHFRFRAYKKPFEFLCRKKFFRLSFGKVEVQALMNEWSLANLFAWLATDPTDPTHSSSVRFLLDHVSYRSSRSHRLLLEQIVVALSHIAMKPDSLQCLDWNVIWSKRLIQLERSQKLEIMFIVVYKLFLSQHKQLLLIVNISIRFLRAIRDSPRFLRDSFTLIFLTLALESLLNFAQAFIQIPPIFSSFSVPFSFPKKRNDVKCAFYQLKKTFKWTLLQPPESTFGEKHRYVIWHLDLNGKIASSHLSVWTVIKHFRSACSLVCTKRRENTIKRTYNVRVTIGHNRL